MPTIKINSSEIYFSLSGRGGKIALLFVHGSGADHTLWGFQRSGLRDEFSIAALDLNGHGRSPRREGDGLATYTQDVLAVMGALKDPIFLIGHSLGGAITLNVALQKPQNLVAIGLIGTGAKLRVHPQILELIQSDFEKAVDFILSWAFKENPDRKVHQKARGQMLSNEQAALWRDFSTCDAFNVMDRLSKITVPALVVCGREDKLTPVKYSEYLKNNIRDAELHVIENAGHMVMLEQPKELNRVIRDFVSQKVIACGKSDPPA